MKATVVLLTVIFNNKNPKISVSSEAQASWSPWSELPPLPSTTSSGTIHTLLVATAAASYQLWSHSVLLGTNLGVTSTKLDQKSMASISGVVKVPKYFIYGL